MIDISWPLPGQAQAQRGNLLWRSLHRLLLGTFPFERNPALGLLEPGAGGIHGVRHLAVPIGDHFSPAILFTPKKHLGSTVLLVHGTSASDICPYYLVIRELLAHGHQVLTFHLDGHGGNPRPLRQGSIDECVPAAIHFLAAELDVEREHLGMLGVSLGGACALHAGDSVKALVSLGTPTSLSLTELDKAAEAVGLFVPEMYQLAIEATPNCMLAFVTDPVRVECGEGATCEEIDLLDVRMMPFIDETVRRLDPVASAGRLNDTALLVVNGAWDRQATPEAAVAIFDAAPGPKELALVPRRNHFTLITSQAVAELAASWFDEWL